MKLLLLSFLSFLILLAEGSPTSRNDGPTFPTSADHLATASKYTSYVNATTAYSHLERITSIHTRYFWKSAIASELLRDIITSLPHFKGSGATVELFEHTWKQRSVIVKIPPLSGDSVVVIGAHIDSVNLWLPFLGRAPGANDNASGVVSVLQALELLLRSYKEIGRKHGVHIHFYSAEEAGLVGSFDIFRSYREANVDVVGALVLDMTGTQVAPGNKYVLSVVKDYVDRELAEYVYMLSQTYLKEEKVVVQYSKCGYACSDHASASRFGYASALITSEFERGSDKPSRYVKSHDSSDSLSTIDVSSILLHAKFAFSFVYELSRSDVVPRKRVMSFGDGWNGYMIRWSAARAADPLGVGLWIVVIIAVACYMRVWREMALLVGVVKKGARVAVGKVGHMLQMVRRRVEGYGRIPMG